MYPMSLARPTFAPTSLPEVSLVLGSSLALFAGGLPPSDSNNCCWWWWSAIADNLCTHKLHTTATLLRRELPWDVPIICRHKYATIYCAMPCATIWLDLWCQRWYEGISGWTFKWGYVCKTWICQQWTAMSWCLGEAVHPQRERSWIQPPSKLRSNQVGLAKKDNLQ